jgi:allene oxide cyclase
MLSVFSSGIFHKGDTMNRKSFFSSIAIALLAIVSMVGLSVVSSVDHMAHAASYTVIHVVEHYNNNVIIDLGPKGDSMGDLNPFADPIYDATNKKQVGYESGSCIRTIVGKLYECNWTVFLKNGQISVEGPNYDNRADSVLAITGGTGIYHNARGELKAHARNKAATVADYVFYLS